MTIGGMTREISGHFGSSAMPVMENCIDPLAGDRAGGSVWCLWVSGGKQKIRRRHKLTMSAWMIRSDVSQAQQPVTELVNLTFSTKATKSSNEGNQVWPNPRADEINLSQGYGKREFYQKAIQDHSTANWPELGYHPRLQKPSCHLSSSGHQSGNNKWSTFILSNIRPQDKTLNKGAWRHYETDTMVQLTQGCTTTYVITSAVPGSTYISNERVNVPSHIWSAACCQTNTILKTWEVIEENNRNQVQNLTLGQLEARLTQLYGRGKVSLFHSAHPH
ncbi:hypothetical protein HGM15179_009832 [Zosterops borbonicus]|uniref:Uncharacterized protein n=1 Tax=Zosterops borbonicus TaxID=364589 RepID=A0A8K1GEJ0_9PASS|nr:hypothetical protein HGM15179_009832 [Zosterops borbonicus]